jgi:hypothetical protein
MHQGVWPLQTVWDTCDAYAKLGLPIHFTETTIVSGAQRAKDMGWDDTTPRGEAAQAEQTVNFYTALFAHPAVEAITWWDFSDHGAWQGAPAGLLRRDMSPKPVYDRLMSLIREQWWTKTQTQTGAAGQAEVRAFYGKHRVTVVLPNGRTVEKDVQWQRGQANHFELVAA